MPKTAMEKNLGELFVDHSNSPGIIWADIQHLPAHVRDTVPLVGEGERMTFRTLTCAHCKTPWLPNPKRVRDRAHCNKCMDYVCDPCAATGVCRPFMALADAVLGSDKPVPTRLLLPPTFVRGN